MNDVVALLPGSPGRLLSWALERAGDGHWVVGYTAGKIAQELKMSRVQLYRAKDKLEKLGYIVWFGKNGSRRGVKIAIRSHKRFLRAQNKRSEEDFRDLYHLNKKAYNNKTIIKTEAGDDEKKNR